MMYVAPKWKVTIRFSLREDVVFWISDVSVSNVLRTVAGLDFIGPGPFPVNSTDRIDQPIQIVVGEKS